MSRMKQNSEKFYNGMSKLKIHHFKSLSSTQDKAKEYTKKGLSNLVVVSEVQTKSRGRLNRKWVSSKGGLWISILVKPKNIEKLQYLTFAAAVSVQKSIRKIAKIDAKIKWPNDVHYKGKKIGGILTEGIFGKENHVIVGIGLNVNQTKFPSEIKNLATSLKIIAKKSFDMKKLEKNIVKDFFNIFNSCYNNGKFDKILALWKDHCDTLDKDVEATTRKGKISGFVSGVDNDCNLLLKLKTGEIMKIAEGDIKVR